MWPSLTFLESTSRWAETRPQSHWDEDVEKTAESVEGFVRLTFHSCRHGIANKLLRDKIDVVTAASIAGMSVKVMLSTYVHAMKERDLTERLFDTPVTRDKNHTEQNQHVAEK